MDRNKQTSDILQSHEGKLYPQEEMQGKMWWCEEDDGIWIQFEGRVNRRKPYVVMATMECFGFYATFEKAKKRARSVAYVNKGVRLTWKEEDT